MPEKTSSRARRSLLAVCLTTTAALLLPALPAAAAPAVEGFAPYVGQVSCDPRQRPGTVALAAHVLATYRVGRSGGTVRACGGSPSEHQEGRAWDWMVSARVPAQRAAADRFTAWLVARGPDGRVGYQARRLGVMYVIWNGRQWSAHRPADGWRPYRGASAHTDHVHVSLSWNGAMRRTSFWTGRVAPTDYGPCRRTAGQPAPRYTGPRLTPCPAPARPRPVGRPAVARPVVASSLARWAGTTVRPGSRGPAVQALQSRLGLAADGAFGPATRAAVVRFQAAKRLTADGVVGAATWRALGAQPVRTPPRAARAAARPAGAKPAGAQPVASLARWAGTTVRLGSRGPAVQALQSRLGLAADGAFGPATRAAVVRFQAAKRLTADGVVGAATWRALGA